MSEYLRNPDYSDPQKDEDEHERDCNCEDCVEAKINHEDYLIDAERDKDLRLRFND